MEVGACRQPGVADRPNDVAALHVLAFGDGELAEVAVAAQKAAAVVDDDHLSAQGKFFHHDDTAGIRGDDRCALLVADVGAAVVARRRPAVDRPLLAHPGGDGAGRGDKPGAVPQLLGRIEGVDPCQELALRLDHLRIEQVRRLLVGEGERVNRPGGFHDRGVGGQRALRAVLQRELDEDPGRARRVEDAHAEEGVHALAALRELLLAPQEGDGPGGHLPREGGEDGARLVDVGRRKQELGRWNGSRRRANRGRRGGRDVGRDVGDDRGSVRVARAGDGKGGRENNEDGDERPGPHAP